MAHLELLKQLTQLMWTCAVKTCVKDQIQNTLLRNKTLSKTTLLIQSLSQVKTIPNLMLITIQTSLSINKLISNTIMMQINNNLTISRVKKFKLTIQK